MEREEKIRIAVTAGIASIVLLILVLFLALGGKKTNSDEEKLAENIAQYTDSSAGAVSDAPAEPAAAAGEISLGEADTESSSEASSEASTAQAAVTTQNTVRNTAQKSVSGNSFYETKSAVLKDVYKGIKYNTPQQLTEMRGYWAEGNMNAVRDLAHLERFEVMSYSLSGTTDFYYYGDTNSEGLPNGMGIALYADDQYYYGQWVNGKRSGEGCWIAFYPGYSQYVVTEHMYTGQWSQDLPTGQGQEHYDYNADDMNEEDVYIQNVIGGFSGGNYNGDMYVITVDVEGNTTEWTGICENGDWQQVLYSKEDASGKIPVLSERENTDHHLYMSRSGAAGSGIRGIITGGSIRK